LKGRYEGKERTVSYIRNVKIAPRYQQGWGGGAARAVAIETENQNQRTQLVNRKTKNKAFNSRLQEKLVKNGRGY